MLYGSAVPGFSFIASIVAIFSGVQLFALGVIGEYLARMHFRSMERPPYVRRFQTFSKENMQEDRKKKKEITWHS